MLHSVEMTEFFLSLRFFVKSKIGELRDSKSAILTNWEALKFEFWWLKFTNSTNLTVPKMAQLAILELLDSPKLISRKILMTEWSWTFHTVHFGKLRGSELWFCGIWAIFKDQILPKLKFGSFKTVKTIVFDPEDLTVGPSYSQKLLFQIVGIRHLSTSGMG